MKTRIGIEKVRLTESDLKRISVLDKTASTCGTIVIVVGSLGIIFFIIVSISGEDYVY